MKQKKIYLTPRSSQTRVVLEKGLASSGENIDGVTVKTKDDGIEVLDYTGFGGASGASTFTDITFD